MMRSQLNLETGLPECKRQSPVSQIVLKRIFDILFSFLVIIILSPFLLIISLFIFLLDGRPVLFRQKRVGKDSNIFEIYKFRTMRVVEKEPKLSETDNWTDRVPDSFVYKSGNNPETTKVGKVLRKYSLDELPQFFNVLKGEMSIVGPRPEIPDIVRCYDYIQKQRLLVKPGITGLAQISGRSELTHGEKIKHDLEYVNSWSFLNDIKILVRTIWAALRGKGAF